MTKTINKIEPMKVKSGDLMAFINYVKVKDVRNNGLELMTQDLNGKEIHIKGKDLIENGFSADQFGEERKVTKTEAAEILISSPNRPITVCFEKQGGKERVLRGRFIKQEMLLGRSFMEDLDINDGSDRLRQVDHRGLKFLVVDGVKYVVK